MPTLSGEYESRNRRIARALLCLTKGMRIVGKTGQTREGMVAAVDAALRRLDGLYMATFFAGGAIGSAVGGWAWASWAGMALPIAALLYWMTERQR